MSNINLAIAHIRPEILSMGAYHVPDASGLIKLDAMENPYTLPDNLKTQLAAHLAQVALNRYPVPSYIALKDALRAYAHIPADKDIMLGNGSDELIAILSQAISKSNETVTVLAPAPSFVMYKMSGLFNHLNVVEIALNADDFSLDVAAFVAAIAQHKPALVYLPFPNNPTGNLFDASAMRTLIEAAKDSIVVVDEAYQPFALNTWMSELGEFADEAHDRIGLLAVRLGIKRIVVVGSDARRLFLEAISQGSWDAEAVFFETADAAFDYLTTELTDGDRVLVKSSNSAGLRFLGDRLGEYFS